jgi:hypothetical protein
MGSKLPWCALVFVLGVVIASAERPAAAQPKAAAASDDAVEGRKREAKERFLRGVELTQRESWDAALAEFLASRELYPTKVAIKNAAVALRQLGRHAQALEMYQELLEQFSSSIDANEKKEMEDSVAQLRDNVGEIDVESNQRGSTIVIDGQQRGTTPLSAPILVNAGTHSVRVSKEGFEAFEAQVLVAGKQKKVIQAKLDPLAATGTLIVREASGKSLEVLVDGALVGKTPWQGRLAVGAHSVLLRGEDDTGTPPSAADVRENQASTLTLRAIKLDAEIRIEPTPSNATVFVDGVQVGNGVWEGRLRSGAHKVELIAQGFLPQRRDVSIKTGQREVLSISLERDLSDPMWRGGFVPHLYAELVGGALWSPSLRGGADAACDREECSERGRPFGFVVGARGGYALTSALGVEVFLGYLKIKESMTRTVVGQFEGTPTTAQDYEDSTSMAGPMAAVSASYRFFEKTPLTLRVWGGVARVNATFSNQGTFESESVSVPEKAANVWVPLFGPEVRIGYQISEQLGVDFGVAFLLMLAPSEERQGRNSLSDSGGRRAIVGAGVLELPTEHGFGTFFAIAPTLAGRFDF